MNIEVKFYKAKSFSVRNSSMLSVSHLSMLWVCMRQGVGACEVCCVKGYQKNLELVLLLNYIIGDENCGYRIITRSHNMVVIPGLWWLIFSAQQSSFSAYTEELGIIWPGAG